MRNLNDTAADSLVAMTGITAITHYATKIQPLISAAAGTVAIMSGILACIYHIIKIWQRVKK